ncbi:MAG: hypothetical protein LAN37_00970 [Acidobacteriia bacterium]|nr:hypothetical protein [Terriglobia bacterium]
MKNIVEVIKQKERDILQKKREIQQMESDIETLRAAARLLADDGENAPVHVVAAAAGVAGVTRPSNGEVKQFP